MMMFAGTGYVCSVCSVCMEGVYDETIDGCPQGILRCGDVVVVSVGEMGIYLQQESKSQLRLL
jgi:hypothetical protein